jgi:hypothetical protein
MTSTAATTTHPAEPAGAFPPPPGATVNLDDPADYRWTLNVVGLSVCCGLLVVFFLLRCLSKYRLGTPWCIEDWACAISWALCISYISMCFMMARYGEGHHSWEITEANYVQMLKWLYASSIVWIPAAFAVKATLLLLIIRVFAVYVRVAKAIRLYICFLFIAYAPVQFVKIFICTPISKYWDSSKPGHCLDQPKIFLTDTALAFITDFIILLIPILLTFRLRMTLKKKLKIIALLGAGGVAVAVACFREYRIYIFQSSTDVSGDFVVLNLCGTIELTIGFVCACLPSINLLVGRCHERKRARHGPLAHRWPIVGTWRRENPVDSVAAMPRGPVSHNTMFDPTSAASCIHKGDAETGLSGSTFGNITEHTDHGVACLCHVDLNRINSTEGRREKWLSIPGDSDHDPDDAATADYPGSQRARVSMQQLYSDPRKLLISERIWDGQSRSALPESSCEGLATTRPGDAGARTPRTLSEDSKREQRSEETQT